jgi:hypothetical protein
VEGVHTFEAEGHRHFIDGARVPSVTQALERSGLRDLSRFTEEGRDRGSDVHVATAIIDLHGWRSLDLDTVETDCLSRIRAFIKFRAENRRFKPLLIETAAWSKAHGFAGFLDRLEEIQPARKSAIVTHGILDVKTGAEDDSTGEQTAGYDLALDTPPPPKGYRERYGLYLHDDGNYNLVPYRDPQDRYFFLSALAVTRRAIQRRGWDQWKRAA